MKKKRYAKSNSTDKFLYVIHDTFFFIRLQLRFHCGFAIVVISISSCLLTVLFSGLTLRVFLGEGQRKYFNTEFAIVLFILLLLFLNGSVTGYIGLM